jgi:hypothetical protein
MQINEDHLCILKQNVTNKQFFLAYEPIEIQFKEDLDELYALINDINNSGDDIFRCITNHPTLNVLFKMYNFCTHLSSPYQGLYQNLNDIKNDFNNASYRRTTLLEICKRRALAYSLEVAYKNSNLNSDVIKAFSHRRVGWSERPFQLDENFSIEFDTNFGYGNSSYFYTRLKYKDIEIVPISEWVVYRYANLNEIILASAVHDVISGSWKQAMEYGQNACNLFSRNQTEFVNQYLKLECEKLLNGLYEIKTSSKFKLRENQDRFNPTFVEVEYNGSELIAYRGDKLSGALNFIDNIKGLDGVVVIANYINKIETYNREIQPILKREFQKISDILSQLKNQLINLKEIYEKLEEKDDEYKKFKSALEEVLEKIEEYSTKNYYEKKDYLENNFLEKYSEYNSFKKTLNDAKEKYCAHESKIYTLKKDLNSIEKSMDKIKSYFKNSTLNN